MQTRSVREEVLLEGLVDWIPLDDVHRIVARAHPDVSDPRSSVVHLIQSLVRDGLVEIGDLANPESRFAPWTTSLDESLERLRKVYIEGFDDENTWPWFCWLALTDDGTATAEARGSDA